MIYITRSGHCYFEYCTLTKREFPLKETEGSPSLLKLDYFTILFGGECKSTVVLPGVGLVSLTRVL